MVASVTRPVIIRNRPSRSSSAHLMQPEMNLWQRSFSQSRDQPVTDAEHRHQREAQKVDMRMDRRKRVVAAAAHVGPEKDTDDQIDRTHHHETA